MATYIKCDKCGEYVNYNNGYSVQIVKLIGSNIVPDYGKANIDLCDKCAKELIDSCKEE